MLAVSTARRHRAPRLTPLSWRAWTTLLALERGEKVETSPPVWFQGRGDVLHDYQDADASFRWPGLGWAAAFLKKERNRIPVSRFVSAGNVIDAALARRREMRERRQIGI
jgi:hypothetical protein